MQTFLDNGVSNYYIKNFKLNDKIKFGIEIEFTNIEIEKIKSLPPQWKVVSDFSVIQKMGDIYLGGEVVSPILDNSSFLQITDVCNYLKDLGASVNMKTGSHVHFGTTTLGRDIKNYKRLLKLWTVFENVIYDFSKHNDTNIRNGIYKYACPYTRNYSLIKRAILSSDELSKMIVDLYYIEEKFGLNLIPLFKFTKSIDLDLFFSVISNFDLERKLEKGFDNSNTIEFRSLNGTLDDSIWYNSITFFSRLIDYVVSEIYDEEKIDRMFLANLQNNYFSSNFDDVCLLANLIFNVEEEKILFLNQCSNDFKNKKFIL